MPYKAGNYHVATRKEATDGQRIPAGTTCKHGHPCVIEGDYAGGTYSQTT